MLTTRKLKLVELSREREREREREEDTDALQSLISGSGFVFKVRLMLLLNHRIGIHCCLCQTQNVILDEPPKS